MYHPLTASAIRLVDHGIIAESEGRVEFYHNGEWGMVCDDAFQAVDGDAFCRFLGFTYVLVPFWSTLQ